MKRILALITLSAALLAGALALLPKPARAQYLPPLCHDEYVCTPFNGCRWVTVCR
jgi:hypothetical protein